MVKKVIIYVLFFIILIACFVMYIILSKGRKYEEIVYKIEYPSDTLFTESELAEYVEKNCPAVLGLPFDSVNLTTFERIVDAYPFLEDADVINNRGTLIVKAKQEKIIAKIFNKNNEQFLLSESGKLVPLSKHSAGRLVVVNGYISIKYVSHYKVKEAKDSLANKEKSPKYYSTLYSIWQIARFINNDPFWKAQIGQIYVNENQEIELIPTVGEHVILFGRISGEDAQKDISEKFKNLKTIYTQGFRITAWDKYKTINLKYGTEIPCEKRVN